MTNFNFLSNLLSLSLGSPCTDVSLDRRLTVGSPSGLDAKWKQNPFMRFAVVLTLIFTIGIGNAWGADVTYTLSSASGNPGSGNDWYSGTIDSYTSWAATNGGSNHPKYYSTGSGLRVYNGGTFTITSSKTIASIKFTFSSTSYTFRGDISSSPYTVTPNATSWSVSVNRAHCRLQKIEITYAVSGYKITYHCNGATSGCPSDASGQTALPNPLPSAPTKTGFTFGGWYTNSTFTTAAVAGATLAADADLYAKWTCNVTLNRNGATETINNVTEGTTLNSIDGDGDQGGCSAWTFVGWSKTQRAAQNVSTAMTLVTTVDGAGPYYAVYSHTEGGGGSSDVTDEITAADLEATETSYVAFEDVAGSSSDAVYAGQSAKNGSDIQLRGTNPAGIVSTTSGGTVKSVVIEWSSSATNSRTINVYGSSTAYSSAADLYNSSTDGDLAGSITYTSSSNYQTTYNFDTDYEYVGIRMNSSATRIASISITWTTSGGGTTYYYSTTATCCTALATINGSFSFSNVSATSVTVGVPSDYSDKNNANLQGYIFKRYAASTGGSALETIETNSSSGTTATFSTGLVANTAYYYTIIAKHSSSSCNSEETSPRKSHTITSYTVSYAAGDGSGTNPGAHNPVLSGTSVTLKANTFDAPAGKQFAGWNDGTNDYDAGDSYSVTANKTMTAQWSCITPHISSQSISHANYLVGATPVTALSVTIDNGSYDYQWQSSSTENGEYSPVAGATSSSFTPPVSATSDLWYKCVITNTGSSCNTTATSNKAHIVVAAPSYRLWTGWGNGGDLSQPANTWDWVGGAYFVQVNSSNEWRITNYTIPNHVWTGSAQMVYNVEGKNTTNTKFYDLAFAVSQGTASVKKGPMPGAVGTLRMYDNSDQPNGYLGFLPNNYMVRFGTHDYIMTETSSTVWETAIQTLDAADLTNESQYRVGVTNSSDEFVAINENCPLTNVTSMGQKSNAGNSWGSNLASGDAGKRGKFRIWLDNATNNWTCHFVPYHRIIFDANWPSGGIGDEPADTYSVDVSVEETNSSISLASAPTAPAGYTFAGWFTESSGGTQRTGAQTISAGATADVTLFAHWTANDNTAYTVKHYQQNIANDDYTLFATQNLEGTTGESVTPATNSYTGFTAPSTETQTILGDGSLVINYYYTRDSYTLTWVLNGGTVTVAGTCAAVNATGSPSGSVKYGASLTAPVVAKTGYNMTWSSSPAATMPATNTTYTANWTVKTTTVSFNQNSGTGGQTSNVTATYGSTMPSTPVTCPTRAGYTFDGYYDGVGGTGTQYYTNEGASARNWDKEDATYTLYAKWTAKEDTYKTALHTGADGWTTYASGVTKSGAGYTIPAPSSVTKGVGSTCEDLHYHFAGWVADDYKGSPSGHIITAAGTTDATGTTYWAVWEKETSGGATTIELNYSNLSVSTSSYAQSSATVGGVGFTINQGYRGGSNPNYLIQMNSSKGDGTLFNTTAISGLQSIKLYCATAGATATIYQGSSEKPTSTSDPDERVGTAACAASTNYTINFTGSGEYFTLKVGGATYFSKIEVSYCTYEDPKAECEACVATPTISGVSLSGSSVSLTSVPVQATGASAGSNCAIASYGFCWGTSAKPTGNSTASANLSDGAFSATLTGPFSVGQTYYYRAFATNEAPNTGYSSDGTFTLRSVTFDLNGHGSSAPSTQYVLNGGRASDPSYSESVTNWRFVGWYDEAACRDGHEWVFGTNTVSGANVTIYAKWLPDPTITFSVPTGVDAVASQRASVNLPTPTGFPSAVDDDCWAFAGWTESSSVNSTDKPATFYPAGAPYSGSQTSAFTLYAVYSRNKYLVVYDNDMLVADADYVITTWESDNYAVVGVADGNNAEVADMAANFHDKVLRGLHYYTLDNPTENAVWHLTGTTGSYVLQNKATGKYLDIAGSSLISESSATLAITEGTGEDKQTYKVTGGDNHLVIASSGASVATGDATYYFLYKLISSKYMTSPAEPTYTVTWKVAGEDDQTSTVSACAGIQASDISALTIPGDDHLEIKNGGCITNTKGKFMGWSTHDYGSASGKGSSDFSDLFKTYDKAPYLTDDITLYAVFAEAGGGGVPYYGLVEEDEDATEGTYLIVYNGTYAMGSHHDGNNTDTYSDYSDISSYYDGTNKKIASNSTTNALAYIAEETTNGYSLKHSEEISSVATDVYLGCSKNDNKALRWDYPFTASTDEWLLAAGSINSVGQSSRYIRWNNTSGQYRFATYGSASCQDIQLYKYNSGVTYSNYRTSCCAKKVTIGTPTKTGIGTVTFASGGNSYAAGDEVGTCEGGATITVTITPNDGHKCTVLEFTRSDEASLTPSPAISVPFTGTQSYNLTFEEDADGVTLNTTVTFVALHDYYIDNMHYNTTVDKSGGYGTAPTLSDESKGEQCTGLHYRFVGWIPETDMNMTTGVPTTTANMVAGGATGKYATGTNYYAIWAEEE